jgi:hypothetical protein
VQHKIKYWPAALKKEEGHQTPEGDKPLNSLFIFEQSEANKNKTTVSARKFYKELRSCGGMIQSVKRRLLPLLLQKTLLSMIAHCTQVLNYFVFNPALDEPHRQPGLRLDIQGVAKNRALLVIQGCCVRLHPPNAPKLLGEAEVNRTA